MYLAGLGGSGFRGVGTITSLVCEDGEYDRGEEAVRGETTDPSKLGSATPLTCEVSSSLMYLHTAMTARPTAVGAFRSYADSPFAEARGVLFVDHAQLRVPARSVKHVLQRSRRTRSWWAKSSWHLER